MIQEEKLIKNLRRRKPRIVAGVIVLVMFLAISVLSFYQKIRVDTLVTPERISEMASFKSPELELPELFCRFHTLAGISSKLMIYTYIFALFAAQILAWLIIQITNTDARLLFISMWDRIQKLEQEMKEMKANS